MTDQQGPTRSDDAAAGADSSNRATLWSNFFRVTEIRARSTPQLVAINGIIVTVAVAFPWMTVTHIHQGGAADWFWVVLLLVADLTVLVCLPGFGVAITELGRRAWRLVTLDDGFPMLPRLAPCGRQVHRRGPQRHGTLLDSVRAIVVFSILFTQVLAAAVGIFVAYEAIRDDRPVGLWVLGPVVTVIALCVLPISVPAAAGSLARRIRRKTGR